MTLLRDVSLLLFPPGATPCPICGQALYQGSQSVALLFLCRHAVHSHCASGGDGLPRQFDNSFVALSGFGVNDGRSISAKIALYVRSFPCDHILLVLSYLLVLRWCEPESTKVVLFAIGPNKARAQAFPRLYPDYNRITLTPGSVHR